MVAPLIDAQKGNAYFALYRSTEQGLVCEKEVAVASPQEIAATIAEIKSPVMIAGDFARKLALVAARAFFRLKNGEGKSPMELEPIYVRRSEAEVLWEKRHKEEQQ